MERFNLKKLSEVEGKEQFCVEVWNRFAALEHLDAEVEINSLLYIETVHQLFIDFKKAYDSVRRKILYNILMAFGVPKKHVVKSV
jgi:hypothetical protein